MSLLGGCKMMLLDPRGPIAADEIHIMIISVVLMLLVIVPVIVMALVFAWRYRESNTKATYRPDWSHSTWIEVVCWTVPLIIIGVLGAITWVSSHELDPYRPIGDEDKTITIQAVALDWKWLFIYPQQNIATVNYVQVPVNVPVKFLITSEGPMNSLLIPQLAGQIYAMAGMQTKLHMIAKAPGDYLGLSANFSGEGFSDMKFTVRASTQESFNQWVRSVKESPLKLTPDEYSKLVKPSVNSPIVYYASANQSLFNTVVMKAMTPMKDLACVTK